MGGGWLTDCKQFSASTLTQKKYDWNQDSISKIWTAWKNWLRRFSLWVSASVCISIVLCWKQSIGNRIFFVFWKFLPSIKNLHWLITVCFPCLLSLVFLVPGLCHAAWCVPDQWLPLWPWFRESFTTAPMFPLFSVEEQSETVSVFLICVSLSFVIYLNEHDLRAFLRSLYLDATMLCSAEMPCQLNGRTVTG